MANDTFTSLLNNNRTYTFKGGLSPSDDSCVVVTLESSKESRNVINGLVAQQVQASAQRAPQLVWEIGSGNYYVLDSRPQGTGTIVRFVGIGTEGAGALVQFADLCDPTKLTMGTHSCTCPEDAAEEMYSFTGGFLTSLALSAQQGQDYITGNLGFMFVGVEQANNSGGTGNMGNLVDDLVSGVTAGVAAGVAGAAGVATVGNALLGALGL